MSTGLSGDAFVKALDSEKIVLVVGTEQENMSISKDILLDKAPFIARQIMLWKGESCVDMQDEWATSVKMFVQWCYRERLPSSGIPATSGDGLTNQLKKRKQDLIDLWIFAGRHEITKLQNEAMQALITLLDKLSLLNLDDVRYIWHHTLAHNLTNELCILSTFALVAKIQDPNDRSINREDLDKLANLKGFTSNIYSATEEWTRFQPPASPRKDKRSKWLKFTEKKEVVYQLMAEEVVEVDEETPPPLPISKNTAKAAHASQAEVGRKHVAGVKREQEEDGLTVRVKKEPEEVERAPNAFREVEMIDLTDD